MDVIIQEITRKIEELERIRDEIVISKRSAPEGRLRIARTQKRVQYFQVTEEKDTIGRYLPKEEIELAERLAQKTYEEKLLPRIERQIDVLNDFRERYSQETLTEGYIRLNPARQDLITPLFYTDEEYAQIWQAVEYEGKAFDEGAQCYYTARGERVRSKSEVIIADTLLQYGIPYRYEHPILTADGHKIYIDFTLLNPRTREVKYLEHFGMMDDDNYRHDFFWKISKYAQNGIVQGKNFYMTFEGGTDAIDIKALRKMIEAFAKEMGLAKQS